MYDNAPKYQVGSSVFFDVDHYRPLESSLPHFFLLFDFLFFCVMRIDSCFTIDRNLLVETLWINWNPRFILEPRWFNKAKPQAKLKNSLSKNPLMITYSMNVMTQQNLEKELSFGQKKVWKKKIIWFRKYLFYLKFFESGFEVWIVGMNHSFNISWPILILYYIDYIDSVLQILE